MNSFDQCTAALRWVWQRKKQVLQTILIDAGAWLLIGVVFSGLSKIIQARTLALTRGYTTSQLQEQLLLGDPSFLSAFRAEIPIFVITLIAYILAALLLSLGILAIKNNWSFSALAKQRFTLKGITRWIGLLCIAIFPLILGIIALLTTRSIILLLMGQLTTRFIPFISAAIALVFGVIYFAFLSAWFAQFTRSGKVFVGFVHAVTFIHNRVSVLALSVVVLSLGFLGIQLLVVITGLYQTLYIHQTANLLLQLGLWVFFVVIIRAVMVGLVEKYNETN